jgi:hypothetical protein
MRNVVIVPQFVVIAVAALGLAPAALAQAPANDNRANAQRLGSPPVTVGGTTVGATREPTDPAACAATTASVWYRLDGTREGRVIVRFDAAGDLDATVIVLRRVRSEISTVACANTDEKGNAQIAFPTAEDGNYLFMVGQRATSQPGTFRLSFLVPDRPERAPGTQLPRGGVTSSVDPLLDQDDAWATNMRRGKTYRINLITGGEDKCVGLAVYRPGTRSFEVSPLRSRSCGGYFTFTPGPDGGGLYSLLVVARSGSGELQYHLEVAPASRDDTAPGLPLRNLEQRTGSLSGASVDVVDLYRFQVKGRSDIVLALAAGKRMQTDLELLDDSGHGVRCACQTSGGARMRLQLKRGRYFLVVRARGNTSGRYRLRLIIRQITKTGISIDGHRSAFAAPGRAVVLAARVSPARSGGRVRFKIDRFDPFEGWVFSRFLTAVVGGDGVARAVWTPPSVGRWRVSAHFLGTITRSASRSGTASLLVGEPL